ALDAHLPERVELVDEHNTRCLGFGLLKEVANPCRPDADKHFDELRSAQAEERHSRFTGNSAGEKRLSGSRRTDEQYAFRNPAAEVGVLLRVFQELDDLFQLVFRLIDAGDIRKSHLYFVVGVDFRAAPSEGHHATLGAAHSPEKETPDADEENQRYDPAEEIGQPSAGDFARILDVFRLELFDQLRVFNAGRRELFGLFRVSGWRLFQRSPNHLIADCDVVDLPVL